MSEKRNEKVEEYFTEIKKTLNTKKGFAELLERVDVFYKVCIEYKNNPLEFSIFADGIMCFYNISQEDSELWLEHPSNMKLNIINEYRVNEKYLGIDEMVARTINFSNILFNTGYIIGQPIYTNVASRLLYILTGEMNALNQVGNSLYVKPSVQDEKEEERNLFDGLISEKEHDDVIYG